MSLKVKKLATQKEYREFVTFVETIARQKSVIVLDTQSGVQNQKLNIEINI